MPFRWNLKLAHLKGAGAALLPKYTDGYGHWNKPFDITMSWEECSILTKKKFLNQNKIEFKTF